MVWKLQGSPAPASKTTHPLTQWAAWPALPVAGLPPSLERPRPWSFQKLQGAPRTRSPHSLNSSSKGAISSRDPHQPEPLSHARGHCCLAGPPPTCPPPPPVGRVALVLQRGWPCFPLRETWVGACVPRRECSHGGSPRLHRPSQLWQKPGPQTDPREELSCLEPGLRIVVTWNLHSFRAGPARYLTMSSSTPRQLSSRQLRGHREKGPLQEPLGFAG